MSGTCGEGDLLGRGRVAQVRSWRSSRAIKIFSPGTSRSVAAEEARKTQVAWDLGLPVPRVWEVRDLEGSPAVVLDLIRGTTMVNLIRARPWVVGRMAHLSARLLAQVHAQAAPADFPSLCEVLRRRVTGAPALPENLRTRVLELAETSPGGAAVCHGDFHPENVIMADSGPVIIDWDNASRGCPRADAVRTLILVGAWPHHFSTQPIRAAVRLVSAIFSRAFKASYCRITETGESDLSLWLAPVAAARMAEAVEGEGPYLLRAVERGLALAGRRRNALSAGE